eukprot:CAMPEP_0202692422 /NCGR_PEP_ID=MMETSP1385-20130828/6808_1 /ASSEMBLY_ACC=CAM_ASM_000861 /TAXON_ID=933848 /ORGANISM="Elphidium margaritaceum" /LENGTH=430 /DNA_ID=CAMNT_0049347949 /DNA_START=37 /DNA_END=1326 /DNA_ORIENTATION=+
MAETEQKNDDNHEAVVCLLTDLIDGLQIVPSKKKKLHKTALFYHRACLLHRPPNNASHVERPERCSCSYDMLRDYGILQHLQVQTPREATVQEIQQSHTSKHTERVCNQQNAGWYDSDTFYNSHSARAAKLSAAATIDLMSGILKGEFDNGFALCRPPGHHSCEDRAMGFCLFNNAVVATECVLRSKLANKVLIVDWDVHHGNGTQDMTIDNHQVLYFSVHRHDKGYFYPSTGKVHETGDGYNVNVPLDVVTDQGYGDEQYLLIWRDVLLPIAKEFAPDIVLISAGFDACIGDPLGQMRITPPCYGLLTRLLLNVCPKVAIVLEGGYNLMTMPRAICCCNYALLAGAKQQTNNYDVSEFYNEFKENITDQNGDDAFDVWSTKYADDLVERDYNRYIKQYRKKKGIQSNVSDEEDLSLQSQCKKTIKNVLQ